VLPPEGDRETPCRDDCTRPRPGSRHEHCRVCHRTFASTTAGDAHRVGPIGNRRCRGDAELIALGLWLTDLAGRRVWHGQANKAGVQRRWVPREQPDVTAQDDDQGEG
jgi:hypothetical protein